MRVIAGIAKGVPIKYPRGAPTRPATELVRGAIFSMLASTDADWSRVLDLFSGSGSLGIEALSRGAGFVDFVDQNRRACDVIKENLENTGFIEQAAVHCNDVSRTIRQLEKGSGPGQKNDSYGIVLMDPPYADRAIGEVINRLALSNLITAESIVVITHSSRFKLEQQYGPLVQTRELRHGDSVIAVYSLGTLSSA
jgi:16S rRNA (guanine966-N2)-methyltransferase